MPKGSKTGTNTMQTAMYLFQREYAPSNVKTTYFNACGSVRTSAVPRFVQTAPLCLQALHGWLLSHLTLLARHQSQALETCFLVGRIGGSVSALDEVRHAMSGGYWAKVGSIDIAGVSEAIIWVIRRVRLSSRGLR